MKECYIELMDCYRMSLRRLQSCWRYHDLYCEDDLGKDFARFLHLRENKEGVFTELLEPMIESRL